MHILWVLKKNPFFGIIEINWKGNLSYINYEQNTNIN